MRKGSGRMQHSQDASNVRETTTKLRVRYIVKDWWKKSKRVMIKRQELFKAIKDMGLGGAMIPKF